jgi:hypothetical protein
MHLTNPAGASQSLTTQNPGNGCAPHGDIRFQAQK